MSDASKLQGTCSVCLREIQLRDGRPIRHGFSAVGVRHGQSGGYHTGPCAGTQFPHLGISSEGTAWALDRERRFLEGTHKRLADLAANPDITWFPKKYDIRGGRADLSKPVVVKHGDERSYSTGQPSYDQLHRARKAELEQHVNQAERAIAEYERVLGSWSPEKYPTTGAAVKVETVHMERPIKNLRGETTIGTLCRSARRGRVAFLAKTDDPAKVTCKRCRATLGLPPLLTAATGIDAHTHCIETFLSPLVNPPAEAIALDGAERAWRFIRRAVDDGADREARWEMMMAALEGGMTFQKGLGTVHSLSHAAGALRSPTLHHGMLNGVFLPHILRFNARSVGNKYEKLRDVFCIQNETDLATAVSDLVQSLGLPLTLSQMGFEARHIPQTVARALNDHSNATAPRKASAEEFEGLLHAAL